MVLLYIFYSYYYHYYFKYIYIYIYIYISFCSRNGEPWEALFLLSLLDINGLRPEAKLQPLSDHRKARKNVEGLVIQIIYSPFDW